MCLYILPRRQFSGDTFKIVEQLVRVGGLFRRLLLLQLTRQPGVVWRSRLRCYHTLGRGTIPLNFHNSLEIGMILHRMLAFFILPFLPLCTDASSLCS